MFFMRKTTALPSAAQALPGRSTPIPTAKTHFVNGRQLQPPYPAGLERAVFGLGCFWARSANSGSSATASFPRLSVTPAVIPRTRPTRRLARAAPVTPRRYWWCSIRKRSPTSNC